MAVFIAGTGTDVGKTLFSALVMARYAKSLGLKYQKVIQTGENPDREVVQRLAGLTDAHFIPEVYSFSLAASPHLAAEHEGRMIDTAHLKSELARQGATIIELAGGLEVPLRRYYTNLDLLREVGDPVILIASTLLGTINHTVLSLKAMAQAKVHCAGVFFIGRDNPLAGDNMRSATEMTGANSLGHFYLPAAEFSTGDFQAFSRDFDRDGKLAEVLK